MRGTPEGGTLARLPLNTLLPPSHPFIFSFDPWNEQTIKKSCGGITRD